MKKLALLIAMILSVTIGGVYAVWTYAGTNDIADVSTEAKVTMENFELTGAAGVYTISSNLVLTVDQASDAHDAELVFASNNGEDIFLTVTFTPAAGADNNIKENAVETTLTFTTTTAMEYKMNTETGDYDENGTAVAIFAFGDPIEIVWTPTSEGTFTFTMDEDDLKDYIMLSQEFILDIKHEYDMFKAALTGNIIAKVTDGVVS